MQQPISLRLTGFVGIHDGLKRDEIFINFENMPPGLIAIVGPNGKGKSTIIDNMHPYRIMPSRSDSISTRSFSFFDHLRPGKGRKEFVWRHADGLLYKADLVFTTKSKKSDCFLFVFKDEQWVPYASSDGTVVSDGKTESFDKAVENLMGSPELFFTSQFLAQNRKALSTYGNGGMKSLMSEMLKIESMKQLSKKAADIAEMLSKELDRRQAEIVKMSKYHLDKESLQNALALTAPKIAALRNSKTINEGSHQNACQQLQALEQSMLEGQKNLVRIQELQSRLKQVIEAQTKRNSQRQLDEQSRVATMNQLREQIAEFEKQLQIKSQVLHAVDHLPTVTKSLQEAEISLVSIRQQWELANAKNLQLTRLEHQLTSCEKDGQNVRANFDRLREQATLISAVPCSGTALNSSCQLLANAHKADQESIAAFNRRKELGDTYKSINFDLTKVKLELADLGQVKVTLDLANEQLTTLRKDQLSLSELAARLDQVRSADQSISDSTKVLSDLEKQRELASVDFAELDQASRTEIERIEAELKSLQSLDLTRGISEVKQIITTLKDEQAVLDGQIEAEIRNQSRMTAELKHIDGLLESEPLLQRCVKALSHEIAHWRQLSIGLGNNGTIALCIDDAGPTLSNLVNQLLACYGSQFSTEIQTQLDMANGNKKEGFEILVHDAVNDTTKKLEFLSGGETVWINDCLCRGIALYLRQNAGNICMTLFSDETDGALDLDRKRQFMQMKRRVLELSGCEREFFISHTPECVDFADAVIDLRDFALQDAA